MEAHCMYESSWFVYMCPQVYMSICASYVTFPFVCVCISFDAYNCMHVSAGCPEIYQNTAAWCIKIQLRNTNIHIDTFIHTLIDFIIDTSSCMRRKYFYLCVISCTMGTSIYVSVCTCIHVYMYIFICYMYPFVKRFAFESAGINSKSMLNLNSKSMLHLNSKSMLHLNSKSMLNLNSNSMLNLISKSMPSFHWCLLKSVWLQNWKFQTDVNGNQAGWNRLVGILATTWAQIA